MSDRRQTLPPLPPWFGETHLRRGGDTVSEHYRFPAMLLEGDGSKDFSNPLARGLFGSLSSDSYLRFMPSRTTMFPSIRLNIRENHFVGTEQKDFVRKLGLLELPKTKYGREGTIFAYNHVDEEWEYTLDMLTGIDVRQLSTAEATSIIGEATAQSHLLFRIYVKVKPGIRPAHTLGQAIDAPFTSNSPQTELSAKLPDMTSFSLLVSYRYDCRPAYKSPAQYAMRAWLDVCLPARHCSLIIGPTDDWMYGRHEAFRFRSTQRFQSWIEDHTLSFPVPEHLVTYDNVTKEPVFKRVYGSDQDCPPKTHFASMDSWEAHFLPALFYEHQEELRQRSKAYTAEISHVASIEKISCEEFKANLRLLDSSVPRSIGTPISLWVSGVGSADGSNIFLGKVVASADTSYYLTIQGPIPVSYRKDHRIFQGDKQLVRVQWIGRSPVTIRRIQAVVEASKLLRRAEQTDALRLAPGKQRGLFNLARIIKDDDGAWLSSGYYNQFSDLVDTDSNIFSAVKDLHESLDQSQSEFFESVIDGVRSNTLLLDAVGSRKLRLLAVTICALMCMGVRVMIASQSNMGVDSLFNNILTILEQTPSISHLRSKAARFSREDKGRYKLLLLACTSFEAWDVGKERFQAQVVILDGAGMATEADLLMAIIKQIGRLELLVLAGDPYKTKPLVQSDLNDRNPLGNMMATSTLRRLMEGWPQIARVVLE